MIDINIALEKHGEKDQDSKMDILIKSQNRKIRKVNIGSVYCAVSIRWESYMH